MYLQVSVRLYGHFSIQIEGMTITHMFSCGKLRCVALLWALPTPLTF